MTRLELLDQLAQCLRAGQPAVWVSVLATRGSTPRDAGAAMLVRAGDSVGSIGGGRLEQRAEEIAATLLAQCTPQTGPPRRIERFPLGARLGQCCGGEVHLAFDVVVPARGGWVANAQQAGQAGRDWRAIVDGHFPGAGSAAADELHVALFGAGHVGRALAGILAGLPLRLTWIDTREAALAPGTGWPPHNLRCLACEAPQDEVATLAADSAVVVMTQSHALDLEIIDAALARADLRFIGLIGSRTKRARFEHQLRLRGHGDASLARLGCPIGIGSVRGKEPEVIAVAVAAQLLELRNLPERSRK